MTQHDKDAHSKKDDGEFHAAWAKAWSHFSPESGVLAWLDWSLHLASSPAKLNDLIKLGDDHARHLSNLIMQSCINVAQGDPLPQLPITPNQRLTDPAWDEFPYSLFREAFQLQSSWWAEATQGIWGVDPKSQRIVEFATKQWLDAISPFNVGLLNPVVQERTRAENGANLLRGLSNLMDDFNRSVSGGLPPGAENFQVGRDVAVSPGKVVLRNRLIELIQYEPTTEKVNSEPLLIVPAWIMKYYILDLSPRNSLIRYLVGQGFTVFCISWRNPSSEDRELSMEDYQVLGIQAALSAINAIVPKRQVHAAGYCLGGTLLSIAAAAMSRDGDTRLASLTLLAAQTDFSEPGELGLFISEGQLALLEAHMAVAGYLDARQMSGAFQMLRSYELVWSRIVNEYMLGDRRPMNDLMAWNADTTNMPARMHSEYLRRLYLNNDLSGGRYLVDGRPVSLGDINLPTFCVGTTSDHVAPWQSVYKLHLFSQAEITFVLTNGGHNAGIVSEPGRPRREYLIHRRLARTPYQAPDEWRQIAQSRTGSWWPAWVDWLNSQGGTPVKPPRIGTVGKGYRPCGDAPGNYVKERASEVEHPKGYGANDVSAFSEPPHS